MTTTRWWFAAFMLAAAFGTIDVDAVPNRKPLGPPDQPLEEFAPAPPVNKDSRINVTNIADLLKRGNVAAAKKLASDSAALFEDVSDLDHLYRPRSKGGLGWGAKPMPNQAQDGIDIRLRLFARLGAQNALGDAANEQVGWWIAAMAELTIAMAPKKDAGRKTKLLWINQSEALREAAKEFRKASVANNAVQLQQAATRVNTACVNCHIVFKE